MKTHFFPSFSESGFGKQFGGFGRGCHVRIASQKIDCDYYLKSSDESYCHMCTTHLCNFMNKDGDPSSSPNLKIEFFTLILSLIVTLSIICKSQLMLWDKLII